MGRITRHIPNTLTCCNLLSGCLSVAMTVEGKFEMAAAMILVASVFDFLDGFAARMLKAYSSIGGELDSLSDVVSFGVAPAVMLFALLADCGPMRFAVFVIPIAAALRLAKFNTDAEQKTTFKGLPVPATAMFFAAVSLAMGQYAGSGLGNLLCDKWFLIASALLLSVLMVSRIKFFSLKVKNLKWNENRLRYLLLAAAVLFVVLWKWAGMALAVLFYIVLSLATQRKNV